MKDLIEYIAKALVDHPEAHEDGLAQSALTIEREGRLLDLDPHRSGVPRVLLAGGFDVPPDRVPARATRGERRLVTERALVPLERREHDPALLRLVAMLEEEERHRSSVSPRACGDIGRAA